MEGMVRFYAMYAEGYLVGIGTGGGGTAITEARYSELLALIRNKPAAPAGHEYRITEADEYELVAVPEPEPVEDDELTAEEALDIILGGGEAE